ncbi:MAG: HAMP domain-containing histidine kinase [Hyphomicrobiales bacterium]|nr:HAMP domain-containing histidine kinase [Hyphomicrobiales bacterium]
MRPVTAEMIERGRRADPKVAAEHRRRAQKIQQTREKLTSGDLELGAFDKELVYAYAQDRQAYALRGLMTLLAVCAMALTWAPPVEVAIWGVSVGCSILVSFLATRTFLSEEKPKIALWQRRFLAIETLMGVAWSGLALVFLITEHPDARIFVLATLLLVGSINAMAAAAIPRAVYACIMPMAIAVAGVQIATRRDIDAFTLLVFLLGALLFLLFLAHRTYQAALNTLRAQAEKDGLIAELEQAKANSDEARRRAEEASLAKSRFLATMSHELRTPLNAILGFSEVMKGELFGAHNVPVYREYANDIHTSGEHLLALINEILDLSRVEAGRYELKEDAIRLAAIVEDCQHLLTMRAQKRQITISERIEPDLPRLWADERAIRQVVLNLLTNAVKFTPQGGQVMVKVGWTATGGQYVSIKDTGPGIPEAEIPVVLSSFGRGTLAQKNADEGSGLGLPIVKGLVELHGGVFTLRSKLREGVEVIVIFPPERVMNALPKLDPSGKPSRKVVA